jgi:hypothetical protein
MQHLVENSKQSPIIYYISFRTINFPCFLPYYVLVLYVIEYASRSMFNAISHEHAQIVNRKHTPLYGRLHFTYPYPDLPSEGAPAIDKTIHVNANRNKYPVVRPTWALKPGLTDRLVVCRNVTYNNNNNNNNNNVLSLQSRHGTMKQMTACSFVMYYTPYVHAAC